MTICILDLQLWYNVFCKPLHNFECWMLWLYTCLVNDLYYIYIYRGDAVRFPAIIILLIATRLKVMDLRWLIFSTALVVDLSIQGWSLMSQTQCIINAVFLCACSSVHSTTSASGTGPGAECSFWVSVSWSTKSQLEIQWRLSYLR